MTSANSAVELIGDHLTATATALLFNYTPDSSATDRLTFYRDDGVSQARLEYSTGPFNFTVSDCETNFCFAPLGDFRSGVGVIAGTSDSTTPLPAALPLFLTGIAGAGLLRWRKKKVTRTVS
jgi:hypothetical protein